MPCPLVRSLHIVQAREIHYSNGKPDVYKRQNLVFIRIYSLLGRILKFLYEMNLDTGDLERESIQVYTRFDSFRTYEQFVKWLTQLCASVCEKMDSS